MTQVRDLSKKAQSIYVDGTAQHFELLVEELDAIKSRIESIALDDVAGGDDVDAYVSDIKRVIAELVDMESEICYKYEELFKEYAGLIDSDGKESWSTK